MRVDDNGAPAKKAAPSGKKVNSGNYSYKTNDSDKTILNLVNRLIGNGPRPKTTSTPKTAPKPQPGAMPSFATPAIPGYNAPGPAQSQGTKSVPAKPAPDPTGLDALASQLAGGGVPAFNAMNKQIAANNVKQTAALPKTPTPAKVPAKPAPKVLPSHATPAAHLPAANVPVGGTPSGGSGPGTPTGGSIPAAPKAAPVLNSQGETLHDIQTRLALQDQAGKSVDAELNPQLSAIAEQLKQLTGHHDADVSTATQNAARQQSDLAALYDRLNNFTGGVKSTQDANYASESQANAANFSNLQNQLAQTRQASQQSANSELDRLGLGAVAPAATAALTRDGAYLSGLANVNAANSDANLAARRGGFDSLMAMMQGNAQTEGTVQQGQASRDSAKTLADLNSAFNDASGTLNSQATAIKGTRGAKVQELISALQHQKLADQQAADTANFNQQLALSKLGISQGQLTLNQQKALSQAGLTQAQITHLANSDSVAQQNANTAKTKAAAAGTAKAGTTKPPTGLDGAMSILNGYTGSPHQRDVANEFQAILNGTYNDKGAVNSAGQAIKPGKPTLSDPVTMQHIANWFGVGSGASPAPANYKGVTGLTQADYDTLIRALAALNNKVGHA